MTVASLGRMKNFMLILLLVIVQCHLVTKMFSMKKENVCPIQETAIRVDNPLDTGYLKPECRPCSSFNHETPDRSNLAFLPKAIIAGTMKGGTQTLMKFLLQHPQIDRNQPKELHVLSGTRLFRNSSETNLCPIYKRYQDIASATANRRQNGIEVATASERPLHNSTDAPARTALYYLDKSPEYMLESHSVPQRVVCAFGSHTKVLMLLRNPVDRALSHYHHKVRSQSVADGAVDLPSFEEMMESQVKLLHPLGLLNTSHYLTPREEWKVWDKFQRDSASPKAAMPKEDTSYGLVSRSLYHIQIKQWMAVFQDKFGADRMWEHLKIVDSDSLRTNKEETYVEILEFLGLAVRTTEDSTALPEDAKNTHKGNYEPISDETRQRYEGVFESSNNQLRDLLSPHGIRMSWL